MTREIELTGGLCTNSQKVTHMHFGGGSPTIIKAADFTHLMQHIRNVFNVSPDAEIAFEIDPRQMSEAKAAAYFKAGVTRASIGVQDFDQKVLQSVNRTQPFYATYETLKMLRDYGIDKINIDLMYGLPHQTQETITASAEKVLLLNPDRISLFGYAHVPWMKKHMRLVPEQALPDAMARLDLFDVASKFFCNAGYIPIGIDHFAKLNDTLARANISGNLRRNFQGYTDDISDALIGFGVSAISQLPQGFLQNSSQMPSYREALLQGKFPAEKFFIMSDEDRLREDVIQSLMCNFCANIPRICTKHGYTADYLHKEINSLKAMQDSGLIKLSGDGTINILSPQAARLTCAAFDTYLQPSEIPRHVTAT